MCMKRGQEDTSRNCRIVYRRRFSRATRYRKMEFTRQSCSIHPISQKLTVVSPSCKKRRKIWLVVLLPQCFSDSAQSFGECLGHLLVAGIESLATTFHLFTEIAPPHSPVAF